MRIKNTTPVQHVRSIYIINNNKNKRSFKGDVISTTICNKKQWGNDLNTPIETLNEILNI